MQYLPLPLYNCSRRKTVFPRPRSRLPIIAALAPLALAIHASPPSGLALSDVAEIPIQAGTLQILPDYQNMHPASYPTTYRELDSKIAAIPQSAMVLPFPAVDYFGMSLSLSRSVSRSDRGS
jgi:hypothetical protein